MIDIRCQWRPYDKGGMEKDLLQRLQLDARTVAIEHNREIVHRDRWATVKVQAGDRLEIVHLVGGG